MISRAQRILFAVMLIAVVTMSAILIRLHERAQDRLHTVVESAPLIEDAESAPQSITLVIPNDLDGSLQEVERSIALPADDSAKARVLLETLLEGFHDPHSTHPIAALINTDSEAAAVSSGVNADLDDVFLMPVPEAA
ncbi:MAG: hypothetical protein WBP63_12895, partial [Silvibacterium sp.]